VGTPPIGDEDLKQVTLQILPCFRYHHSVLNHCEIALHSFQFELNPDSPRRLLINPREARFMTGDNPKESPVQAAVKSLKPVPQAPSAVEKLFQAHHERIFRAAHRITGSVADSEDVLQTVFLRLVKSSGDSGTWVLSDNPAA